MSTRATIMNSRKMADMVSIAPSAMVGAEGVETAGATAQPDDESMMSAAESAW
jgi:hypothetical protein